MCMPLTVQNVWCSWILTTSLLPDVKLLSFEAHGDAVWDISWTAKDNAVVSISADGIIKRWNSASGQVMHTAPAHTLGLVSLSVSPDGRYALYSSVDGTIFLWDLETGAIIGKHESYTRPGAEPCKSPCQRFLYIHDTSKFILFTAWSVSLNPRGGTFAATGGSGNVTIHSAEGETFGEQRTTLQSGRGKFGMRCSHVSLPVGQFPNKLFTLFRAPMALGWHYLLKVARSSYLTSLRALSPPRIRRMPWVSAPCHGPLTLRFVTPT